MLALGSDAAIAQEDFSTWLEGLKQEALANGISERTSIAAVNHVEFLPEVIKLDRAQPEFISPFIDYYLQRVDASKIAKGRALLIEHEEMLDQIQAQYSIPKTILVAFWGMETQYGRNQGNIDVLSTLATLAYDGRRQDFFYHQLLDAMRMIESGHASVDRFKGSWAGAFGNMQFMPSTFMLYAVDGDGDDKIDLVNSLPDAFASAANYLSQVGWRTDEPAIIEVQLPDDFDWNSAQLTIRKPVEEWSRLGVRALRADAGTEMAAPNAAGMQGRKIKTRTHIKGKKVLIHKAAYRQQISDKPKVSAISLESAALDVSGKAAILLPQGWQGPAFMVFDNFDVIMDWNRSVNYALSVAQLAKRLKYESRIIGGQFAEEGALSFDEMFQLQHLLIARGFDAGVPDGFPGLQTQAAIRAYQLSQRLPADGYASPSLYRRLLSER